MHTKSPNSLQRTAAGITVAIDVAEFTFVMRRRKLVLIAGVMGAIVILLAFAICPSRSPVELEVVDVDPSGMDNHGKETLLITLTASNRDDVSVMFDRVEIFQAKVEDRWIEVHHDIHFHRLAPGQKSKSDRLVVMPMGTEAFRVQLNYQSEIWKARLMAKLGLNGRRLLAKSPLLCKWVWPDQWKTMPTPPRWKQVILEVAVPQSKNKPAEVLHSAHNQSLQPAPAGVFGSASRFTSTGPAWLSR